MDVFEDKTMLSGIDFLASEEGDVIELFETGSVTVEIFKKRYLLTMTVQEVTE